MNCFLKGSLSWFIYYVLFLVASVSHSQHASKTWTRIRQKSKLIYSTHQVVAMHKREPKKWSLVEYSYWTTPFPQLPSRDGICLCSSLSALYKLEVGKRVCLYKQNADFSEIIPFSSYIYVMLRLVSYLFLALRQLYCFIAFSSFCFQIFI